VVDGTDYSFIDGGFNNQGAQLGSAASQIASVAAEVATTSAVPEPSAMGLLGIVAVGMLGRRRRRSR